MSIVSFISGGLLLTGGIVLIIGSIGLVRFPDFFTRLHAASVVDTLGVMLMIAGLIPLAGFSLATLKLFLILVFVLLTSPTAGHALAKAALHGHLKPELDTQEKGQA